MSYGTDLIERLRKALRLTKAAPTPVSQDTSKPLPEPVAPTPAAAPVSVVGPVPGE